MSHRRALNFSKAEISLRLLPLQRCGTAQDLPSAFVRSAGFEGCDGLIEALDGSSETLQIQYFVKSTLPFIVSEAIAIADRFPDGLPLLVEPSRVCLSRSQVCSILASMFFGVLPLPCTGEGRAKQDWPSASFEYFITERAHPSTTAKLRCVLQYFNVMRERTAAASMNGTVTFCRVALEPTSVPDFSTSSVRMVPLVPHATGSIDDAQHCLHVDFANEYLGGGVLFSGAVQEEIRFSVSPECLAALPLCPSMLRREAILLAGTEVFSKVTGYSRSLLFAGPHEDRTPRIRDLPASDDALASAYGAASSLSAAPSSGAADETREDPNTILSCIVAIDALPFASRQLLPQLEKATFDRDLVKAFVGFSVSASESSYSRFPNVSTGKWGCGAFNGQIAIKILQQWLAASQAGRGLEFYLFDSAHLAPTLSRLSAELTAVEASVGGVYRTVEAFRSRLQHKDARALEAASTVEGLLEAVVREAAARSAVAVESKTGADDASSSSLSAAPASGSTD